MSARIAALALLVASGVAGCDRLPGRPLEQERYRRPHEISDFETLYAESCSGCHGAEGRLGPSRSLADPVYLALVDAERMARIASGGVPGTFMAAFAASAGGRLTEAQLRIIAEGVHERWADPAALAGVALPPYSEAESLAAGNAPGDPGRGAAVFAAFCADCHGSTARGGRKGGSVVDGSFLALVSDQMLRTTVIAGRSDLGMPDWREASPRRPMTDQEISDVVAYLASKRAAFPGRPYAAAGP